MINKKFLEELKNSYQTSNQERRQIISAANNILFNSKKSIFALQRQEDKEANKKIQELNIELQKLNKRFGHQRLNKEGSYKAAVEEFVEANVFSKIIKNKKISPIKNISLDYDSYLGGICDAIGELVRYSTNQAAQGNFSIVAKNKKIAEDIMSYLIDFDLTGYLRTKYDQARSHLRKLEQMAYEIKLKTKK